MKHLFIIASLALVCAACSNEAADDSKMLNATPSSITLDSYLDTANVAVSSSEYQLASVTLQGVKFLVDDNLADDGFDTKIGWLGISKVDGTLQLSSWVNPSYDDRNFEVELTSAASSAKVEGLQKGKTWSLPPSETDGLVGGSLDYINATPSSIAITAAKQEIVVTTTDFTEVNSIRVGPTTYSTTQEERELSRTQKIFDKKADWIRVVREGDNLRITVDANETGQNRDFEICLLYMSCANYIYGYQSGI